MAVTLITAIKRFVGLSGDAKPSPAAGEAGSRFYETDTGNTWVWDGAAWALELATGAVARAVKVVTFTGAAGLGAIGTVALFTVTGRVLLERVVGYCTTDVAVDAGTGAASLRLQVAGLAGNLIAATLATDIDTGEWWVDATPDATAVAIPAALTGIAAAASVQAEVTSTGTQKINGGVVEFYAVWRPLSAGALLVAA